MKNVYLVNDLMIFVHSHKIEQNRAFMVSTSDTLAILLTYFLTTNTHKQSQQSLPFKHKDT